MYSWISFLIFHQSCLNNFYGKINIYIWSNCHWHFRLKSFHIIFWIPSARLSTRFDELAINLSLSKVLARSYLITLYVIFPIHLNFPIRSRCVLKAIIHRKKTVDCFTVTGESSFSKTSFLWYFKCMW